MQNLSCDNEFYLHENETHFRINGFALSLALKQRLGATWRWPIVSFVTSPVAKGKVALPAHVTFRAQTNRLAGDEQVEIKAK